MLKLALWLILMVAVVASVAAAPMVRRMSERNTSVGNQTTVLDEVVAEQKDGKGFVLGLLFVLVVLTMGFAVFIFKLKKKMGQSA